MNTEAIPNTNLQESILTVSSSISDVPLNETVVIQNQLIDMGFEFELINKLIEYFEIRSIERAIEYLTKVDGLWNHPFVFDEEQSGVQICGVCGDKGYAHRINYFRQNVHQTLSNHNNNQINKPRSRDGVQELSGTNTLEPNDINLKNEAAEISENIDVCDICMSEKTNKYGYKCTHSYCRECMKEYILNKISTSDVEKIDCPAGVDKCDITIDESCIKSIIDGSDLEKYYKFLKRSKIQKIPNAVMCPIPNCDSYAVKEKKDKTDDKINRKFIKCLNNHVFCTKCRLQGHPGEDCGKKSEKEFKKWIGSTKHIKKCPKCGFFIQKNDGCNHMSCGNKSCRHEFCWICMRQYRTGHFSNPLRPCYGMQNIGQNNLFVKIPFLCYVLMFLKFLGILILLMLALIFSSILMLISLYNMRRRRSDIAILRRHRKSERVFCYTFCVILGLALTPLGYIILALTLLVGPFVVIGMLIKRRYC